MIYRLLADEYVCLVCGSLVTQATVDKQLTKTYPRFEKREITTEEARLSELNNLGRKEYSVDYSDDYGKQA